MFALAVAVSVAVSVALALARRLDLKLITFFRIPFDGESFSDFAASPL